MQSSFDRVCSAADDVPMMFEMKSMSGLPRPGVFGHGEYRAAGVCDELNGDRVSIERLDRLSPMNAKYDQVAFCFIRIFEDLLSSLARARKGAGLKKLVTPTIKLGCDRPMSLEF
jgi:hypothetical protein